MLRFLRSGSKRTKLIWWLLTIITIFTFVILFGTGVEQTSHMRRTDSMASVDGHETSQADYQAALEDQRANYRRQYGTVPTDRDARMVELQAWRALVAQQLVGRMAQDEGLRAYDEEVAWSLKTSPPPVLTSNAAFQTNGTFDPSKGRFVSGLRVQLELLIAPRKYSDEDLRAAKQTAQGLVDRARRGEDFSQLARDYSEGAGADRGGVIDRTIQTAEFGVMGQHMETLQPGGISDAFQDNGRFLSFKLLAKVPPAAGQPAGMKGAQIIIQAHSNQESSRH